MNFLNNAIDALTSLVRAFMKQLAKGLYRLSGGRINPNTITFIGFIMHVPIAWLIAVGHPLWAGVLLLIFGLFDALDGELARLKGVPKPFGMFLDSVTDRAKEIILYLGIAWFLVASHHTYALVWVVAACGLSVLVSYMNAWGEAVALSQTSLKHTVNKAFRGGLMRYQVRMLLLVIALFIGHLVGAVAIIALLSAYTAFDRFISISQRLSNVQD